MANASIGESSNIEEIFKRAIGANQRMIKRSNDFKYSTDFRKYDSKGSLRLSQEESSEDMHSLLRAPAQSENSHLSMIDQSKVISHLVDQEIAKIKKDLKGDERKTEVFLEILRNDLEEMKKKVLSDRKLFDKELMSFSQQSEKLDFALNGLSEDLKKVKNSIKDLTDSLQIVFTLLSVEDEEKPEKIEKKTENLPAETEKNKWVRPKGFSGKKLRRIKPRDSTLDRSELIELLGLTIKNSQRGASFDLNLNLNKRENLDPPVSSRPKLSSSYTSRKVFNS